MPKSTQELYQELLAQGQQYQQQANELLTQYDNRPAFSYNAATDPIFQTYKDQYVHQGQRAMQDTMGQAAALTGGYNNSYAQSVGNQAYNEYLTKLNAQIPALAQQARQAYDAEGDRLLNRYNLALNAANNAYGQGRDALGDLRYEQETAYAHEQDAYNRQQNEQNIAREYATYLLGMGIMPSSQQLSAAGMTPQEASAIQAYYRNQMAMAAGGSGGGRSGGSSGGSGRGSGGGAGNQGTTPDTNPGTQTQAQVIKPAQQEQLLQYAMTHDKADFDAFFQENFGGMKNANEVYNYIKNYILRYGNGPKGGGGGKNLVAVQ